MNELSAALIVKYCLVKFPFPLLVSSLQLVTSTETVKATHCLGNVSVLHLAESSCSAKVLGILKHFPNLAVKDNEIGKQMIMKLGPKLKTKI